MQDVSAHSNFFLRHVYRVTNSRPKNASPRYSENVFPFTVPSLYGSKPRNDRFINRTVCKNSRIVRDSKKKYRTKSPGGSYVFFNRAKIEEDSIRLKLNHGTKILVQRRR